MHKFVILLKKLSKNMKDISIYLTLKPSLPHVTSKQIFMVYLDGEFRRKEEGKTYSFLLFS